MIGKYYAVLITLEGRSVPFEAVQASFGLEDWLRISPSQFYVFSHRSAQEIWKGASHALGHEGITLVIEVLPSNGWVTINDAIDDWFKKVRT